MQYMTAVSEELRKIHKYTTYIAIILFIEVCIANEEQHIECILERHWEHRVL